MAVGDLLADYSFYFRPKRRRQQRFIRQVLANESPSPGGRVIVSLSTLPDRIGRLQPTLESLLTQSRLPDEIVLAIPKFSIRQRREYELPEYLSRVP